MKLSTKGRYAMRIMLHLAMRPDGAAPALKHDIAAAEGLSADYVEQILIRLKAAGLVSSRRGVKGGFVLDCPPETTTVAAILEASEGRIQLAPAGTVETGENEVIEVLRDIWQAAETAMQDVFERHTLAALADRVRQRREAGALTYSI